MAAPHQPLPRTPDPHAAPRLRWGIMGPGWIPQRFTDVLQKHTNQQVVAVGSRNQGRAEEFAAKHSVATAYGSYEQLLADPGIDIIYAATPHTEHYSCALAALAAGKHVLVEKPLGVSAGQAVAIAESAILTRAGGNQARLHTTILSNTPTVAVIAGDAATLTIPGKFFEPGPFTVTHTDGTTLHYDEQRSQDGYGLHFAAAEAAHIIAAGGIESLVHPLWAATATLATMDEIQRQLDIVFPGE